MNAKDEAPAPKPTRVEVAHCAAPEAPPSGPAPSRGKLAVIVAHGMGQQVPFETLELVAEMERLREEARTGRTQKIVTRIVRLAEPPAPAGARESVAEPIQLSRAEVRVTGPDGQSREVHFYECYWAPFTEGKVGIRDCVSFLLAAGWNGLRNAERAVFRRWMFQRWVDFTEFPGRRVLHFATALLVVLSLLLINAIIGAVIASRVIGSSSGAWPSPALLRWLTWDMTALTGLALLLAAGVIGLPALMRHGPERGRIVFPPGVRKLSTGLVWTGLVGTVVVAVAMLVQLVALRHAGGFAEPLSWWRDLLMAVPWVIVALASYGVRWFLVQYVGDVAAYVSSHAVSKFADVRTRICQASVRVARAVYQAWDRERSAFEYERVIVLGHSLGSVVAYDTLNKLMLEDGMAAAPVGVAKRTEMFLTFGSPLDKTAFIFRTQKSHDYEVREGLAAAVQPMIVDYRNRPRRWINVHSKQDWIGGSLEYYDDLTQTEHREKFVQNVEDPDATIPLVAHVQYWRNAKLAETLDQVLTAPFPPDRT